MGKTVKRKHGFAVALGIVGVLFAILLELSKNTVVGWLIAVCLFCAFALLYARVLKGKKAFPVFACWLVFLIALGVVLKITEPPYRAIPAVNAKDPASTGVITVAQARSMPRSRSSAWMACCR